MFWSTLLSNQKTSLSSSKKSSPYAVNNISHSLKAFFLAFFIVCERVYKCCCVVVVVVVVVVKLTLDGGDDLAGGHPQAPLASAETLEQGGREAEN